MNPELKNSVVRECGRLSTGWLNMTSADEEGRLSGKRVPA